MQATLYLDRDSQRQIDDRGHHVQYFDGFCNANDKTKSTVVNSEAIVVASKCPLSPFSSKHLDTDLVFVLNMLDLNFRRTITWSFGDLIFVESAYGHS